MAVVHLCILALFVASTKSTSMYNMYSNMIMLDGKGNYNVSYNYNESADTLQFMVQVRTAGWVGFGVAEVAPNGMMYYDVAIGGVTNNGTSYLQDYLTVGQTQPRLDTQQDWMLMNATEENNITTIKFYRMRNTTDLQNDTAIPKGMSISIVWAYHPMSDKLQHHGRDYRGVYNITLIPVITPTPTIMMAPSTAVVQPVLHSDLTMLDGKGNYNVSYFYNAASDKLEFMVQVRTTGWVGFGVALVAPNMMNYYDVAIGGVTDNGTSYFQDYLTVGHVQPRLDTQQDWMLMNASEENNVTTLKFYRMRNTTDLQNDTAIPHKVLLVKPLSGTFIGFYNVTLIPVITPTPTIMMAPSTAVVQPVPHSDLIMLDGKGNYNVSYYYNAASDKLEFMVQVRTTGWVGFGVAEVAPNMMNYYDVAIGGVSDNGTSYLQDYLTVGRMQPRLDTQQDWTLTNASEKDNVTTLKFYRLRNTTDLQNDTAIPKGMPIHIVWAYHPMSDELQPHGMNYRGVYNITLIPGVTPTAPMTMTPTVSAVATASMPVMPVQATFLNLQDGNYNVSWMYNSSMDTIHFTVEVRATGWIAFGVATTAPTSMMGYDVAIGKVEGGIGSLEDRQTLGFQAPDRDARQDWMLTYSSEHNGITKLKFYRKLNTNDEKDVVIQQGMSIYIVWAYSPTNDALAQHAGNNRGYQQVTLVPAGMTPTTPTPTAVIIGLGFASYCLTGRCGYLSNSAKISLVSAVATASMPIMPVQPTFLNLQDGNYNVSWMYNSSMDTIHFTVEVRATGWIAFGVVTAAPTGMMGYDVAIGKVEGGIGSLEVCWQ
ncbi:DBH-like monooxygenase protein 1 [Stylophora pistillata]|uniref:DBH-like monooxygenase protein 1 n=1 Tax=Stylophora pistillata TaxID=50429 RepID=A0A2B4R0G6_STYPI|nr:DBH-like monooxygenase protein 1 [Stylophora pistillata]